MDIIILLNKDQVSREDERRIKYPLYEIGFDTGQVNSPLGADLIESRLKRASVTLQEIEIHLENAARA